MTFAAHPVRQLGPHVSDRPPDKFADPILFEGGNLILANAEHGSLFPGDEKLNREGT
jgi:hypothetical protein